MREDPIGAGDAEPDAVPDRADRVEGFSIDPGSRAPLDFGGPAVAKRSKDRPPKSWHFEPPLAPPPGADQLTVDAYELERYAYEMATRDHPRRADAEASTPETEFEPA